MNGATLTWGERERERWGEDKVDHVGTLNSIVVRTLFLYTVTCRV